MPSRTAPTATDTPEAYQISTTFAGWRSIRNPRTHDLGLTDQRRSDTRIPYEFGLPEGAVLEKQDDGSVDVVVSLADGIDAVTASIEQPWAVDANGAPVATEYEIFGVTLVQVVHTTSDTAFPVVADPTVVNKWWGIVIRFNRSETASVGLGGAVCNQVVSKIPHPAATVLGAYCGVLATAAAAAYAQPNKCLRVNVGWIGGALNSVTPWIGTC